MIGQKHDAGKPRWSLIQWRAVAEIVEVLEHGARKYVVDNWMHAENAEERYFDGLMRHLIAHRSGETFDPETGLRHLAHVGCNVLFLLWFAQRDPREQLVTYMQEMPARDRQIVAELAEIDATDPFVVEAVEVPEAPLTRDFVCKVCEDKHWVRSMRAGVSIDLCCTACPVPCTLCRGGDTYCKTTPCSCACHLTSKYAPGEKDRE